MSGPGERDRASGMAPRRGGHLDRRSVLAGVGAAGVGAVTGCLGVFETETVGRPPVVEDRPEAVYYPSHVEGMEVIGTRETGDRTVALMYTYAHRFWTVLSNQVNRVPIADSETVHLMLSIWDTETEQVLPMDLGAQFEVRTDGHTLVQRAPWPMLSQPMGFHLGDNIQLDGDGTYTVTVNPGRVGRSEKGEETDASPLRGGYRGKFDRGESVSFEFEYSRGRRNELPLHVFPDRQGEPGAVEPMEMGMPLSIAPAPEDLPGRVLGLATIGDARFVVTATPTEAGTYLAVCPRTPHNRYVLPMVSMSLTLERGTTTVVDDPVPTVIDPERSAHAGVLLDEVRSGDRLTIDVHAAPPVARHEGYETAFLNMPKTTVTLE